MRLDAELRLDLRMTGDELVENLVEEFVRAFRFRGDLLRWVDGAGRECSFAKPKRDDGDQRDHEFVMHGVFSWLALSSREAASAEGPRNCNFRLL